MIEEGKEKSTELTIVADLGLLSSQLRIGNDN